MARALSPGIDTESTMQTIFLSFLSEETGATAVEYGLISSLIAFACLFALAGVGTGLNRLFGLLATGMAA